MKFLFLLAALFLLTAGCTPAGASPEPAPVRVTALPPRTPTAARPPDPEPTPTINSGYPLFPLDGPGGGEPAADAPVPELAWDPAPETPVIKGTFCCGYTTPEFIRNALPEFVIWGDGRYLWVEHLETGGRRVLEGRLEAAQVSAILQRLSEAGFFGWKTRYADESIADFADKCLIVRLASAEKQVCEYYAGAPAAFHTVFNELNAGYGLKGEDYSPTRGFLRAQRFDVDFVSPTLEWSSASLDFASLPPGGAWVEGADLAALWAALNTQPWGPVAGVNGVYFMYTIQVEGLSLTEPGG